MKIYRVSHRDEDRVSLGYSFHGNRRDAERAADAQPQSDVEPIEVTPTKAGILAALNYYASHNNNG